ncbi:MAG: AbrB/MazE/SpoVT family DNA-binding domain-containing protein [Vulcanococcus sp.]
MRVKVQAWGNSLGLRIPKAYASELGVRAGSEMEVNVEAGALRAELAPPAQLTRCWHRSPTRTAMTRSSGASPPDARHGERTGTR